METEVFVSTQNIIIMLVVIAVIFLLAWAIYSGTLPFYERLEKAQMLGAVKYRGELKITACSNGQIVINQSDLYHEQDKYVVAIPIINVGNKPIQAREKTIEIPGVRTMTFDNTGPLTDPVIIDLTFWRNSSCVQREYDNVINSPDKKYYDFLISASYCRDFYSAYTLYANVSKTC